MKAVLLDLDNSLVDRCASIQRYAERFIADFSKHVDSHSVDEVAELIQQVDNGGCLREDSSFPTIKMEVVHILCRTFRLVADSIHEDSELECRIIQHVYEHFAMCSAPMREDEPLDQDTEEIASRFYLEEHAEAFATEKHKGQLYGEHPYIFHLEQTARVACEFNLNNDVFIGCWLHDVMEDCGVSFHEVEKEFGTEIAEIVYCVTDELGRNRKERKAKTYSKIRENEMAVELKLCDRIANLSHALEAGSQRHVMIYRAEYPEFKTALFSEEQRDQTHCLWERLDVLYEQALEQSCIDGR